MKVSTLLLLLALATIGGLVYKSSHGGLDGSKEPAVAIENLARGFPRAFTIYRERREVEALSFDIRKTDSLLNPMLGIVHFSVGAENFECVFHWKEDRWIYNTLEGVNEHAYLETIIEIIKSPELHRFLRGMDEHPGEYVSIPETPAPVAAPASVAPTPAPTPDPAVVAQRRAAEERQRELGEIARKYSGH